MLRRLHLSFFVFAMALATPAHAVDVGVGFAQGPGGYYKPSDRSGPYAIDSSGNATLLGSATSSTGGSHSPSSAISTLKTTGIGTTAVLVSPTDLTNRRTVTNTSGVACEIMGNAGSYGAGHPLPAGGSFTFDASGRTTSPLYVACASTGGAISVLSY